MNNRVVLGVAVRCNFSCFFFLAFLPTKHLGVHMKSFKCVRAFQIELEFESVGFWGKEKTGVPGEKPLGAWERTNNKLNPHMASTPGFEPGPHWWEASALTTAPPLLPKQTPSDVLEKIEKTLNNTQTALVAGWEKERELATTFREFEFQIQFPCGSPSTVRFPPISTKHKQVWM